VASLLSHPCNGDKESRCRSVLASTNSAIEPLESRAPAVKNPPHRASLAPRQGAGPVVSCEPGCRRMTSHAASDEFASSPIDRCPPLVTYQPPARNEPRPKRSRLQFILAKVFFGADDGGCHTHSRFHLLGVGAFHEYDGAILFRRCSDEFSDIDCGYRLAGIDTELEFQPSD